VYFGFFVCDGIGSTREQRSASALERGDFLGQLDTFVCVLFASSLIVDVRNGPQTEQKKKKKKKKKKKNLGDFFFFFFHPRHKPRQKRKKKKKNSEKIKKIKKSYHTATRRLRTAES
jgi:hypothetical protein